MSFNTQKHTLVESEDGSYTAYSHLFQEHYHSTRDGALHESLYKHVIPAFKHHKEKKELTILDICFGLGFNTLATLYYIQENKLNVHVNIFSPEFDAALIGSLKDFIYPEIFEPFLPMIRALSEKGFYKDNAVSITLYIGDAREYLRTCQEQFDVIYQDAFSPSSNPLLWTQEYFKDITALMKKDAILTTYSMSLQTRLALYNNGLKLYINHGEGYRDATLASFVSLPTYKEVDMPHKISCNPQVKALTDRNFFF